MYIPNKTGGRPSPAVAAEIKRRNWWLRLTSHTWDEASADLHTREMARRSRLTSWIILGLLGVGVILLPAGIGDAPTLTAVVIGIIGTCVAAGLNRMGYVTAAGTLLVTLILAADLGADLSAPHGVIDPLYLPSYDLLAIAVILAASILPRAAAFVVAMVNIAAIVLDFSFQPHSSDLQHSVAAYGVASLLVRPIALQVIVATVAYLWVRGTDDAIRRADRAEEMATLEHNFAMQRQQLEIGVQQILETHVRIANGDYSARAPIIQDSLLWQIASSLNNLMARLQKSGQAEHQLRRTEDELRRLAVSIDDAAAGKRPIWPASSGTAADLIIERITGRNRPPAGFLPGQQQQRPPFSGGPVPSAPIQEPPQSGRPVGSTGILRSPGTGPLDRKSVV